MLGDEALQLLLGRYQFETVLDVGCGEGLHSQRFVEADKQVTGIDLSGRWTHALRADYMQHEFAAPFDCIWVSHVLEHQLRPHDFLLKLRRDLKEGGFLAITVPPLKHKIVGGHVSLWNTGLLLYHLILAGFDCREAHCRKYGYNISVVLKKRSLQLAHEDLRFAGGDIERLAEYFPANTGVSWRQAFDGDIDELNWPSDGSSSDAVPVWQRRLVRGLRKVLRRAA